MSEKGLEDRKREKLEAISKIIQVVEDEISKSYKKNCRDYALSTYLDILEYLEGVYHNVEQWYVRKIKERDNGD